MAQRYPILRARLDDGSIYVVGLEYMGRALDGVELCLGVVGFERQLEAILATDSGDPANW